MINKIDDGSGVLDFDDFLTVSNVFGQFVLFSLLNQIMFIFLKVIGEKDNEYDIEIHYKDTFKAFSKDKDGNFKLYLICCTK